MAHGREEASRSTNVARNKRVSTGSNSQLERAARQEMAAQYSCSFCHHVRTFSSARSGSVQRRRCETADLSPGFSTQIPAWPVLQTRPKSRLTASGQRIGKRDAPLVSAGTVRHSGVSSPAFPPRSLTTASSSQFLYGLPN